MSTSTLDAPAHATPVNSTPAAAYTIRDVARLTQTSERHCHRMNDMGKIPGRIRGLGRLVRFSRAAVDAWLAGTTH